MKTILWTGFLAAGICATLALARPEPSPVNESAITKVADRIENDKEIELLTTLTNELESASNVAQLKDALKKWATDTQKIKKEKKK